MLILAPPTFVRTRVGRRKSALKGMSTCLLPTCLRLRVLLRPLIWSLWVVPTFLHCHLLLLTCRLPESLLLCQMRGVRPGHPRCMKQASTWSVELRSCTHRVLAAKFHRAVMRVPFSYFRKGKRPPLVSALRVDRRCALGVRGERQGLRLYSNQRGKGAPPSANSSIAKSARVGHGGRAKNGSAGGQKGSK